MPHASGAPHAPTSRLWLQGAILRSDVAGEVQMKCLLSGMPGAARLEFYNPMFVLNLAPECRFGMNDKLGMDDKAPAAAAAKKCENVILHFTAMNPF
jgi:hypothetical protein